MVFIITSGDNILDVMVRSQESRIGDPVITVNLALPLKPKLSKEIFEEQQNYLNVSAFAVLTSLNKIDQRNRFKASVNLKSQSLESFNFIQGSSSSGLGYALALFNAFWTTVLKKGKGFDRFIFATGEINSNGNLNSIGYLNEKVRAVINYVQNNEISEFYLCIPKINRPELSDNLIEILKEKGGNLIAEDTFSELLGQLLGDQYDGAPLNRWTPFKGLKSFEYEDSIRFFGRENDVDRLYDDLEQNHGFLIVSGPSGSGKSSLIKAGLIPRIVKEHNCFEWLSLTPIMISKSPLSIILNLIFKDQKVIDVISLETDLRQKKQAAFDQIENHLYKKGTYFLFNLDQFEDFYKNEFSFSYLEDIQFILALTKSFEQINTIISIRNEYITNLLESGFIDSPVISNVSGLLSIKAWKDIVIRQAEFSGLSFEYSSENLAEMIINDAINTKNALPMVEFVLDDLYKRACQGEKNTYLKISDYKKLGGLSGAISNRAQQMVEKHQITDQLISKLFDHLVSLNVNGLPYARDLSICDIKHDSELKKVIDLVTESGLIENNGNQIKLAHDSLFNNWLALQDWVEKRKEFLLWRSNIEFQCQNWNLTLKDSLLLKDKYLLKSAVKYLNEGQITESSLQVFILKSKKYRTTKNIKRMSNFVLLPLIITMFLLWDKNQLRDEFYHAEALNWGVPFGIGELTKEQLLNTKYRLRFIYEGGWGAKIFGYGNKLMEVRYENLFGNLVNPNKNTMRMEARRIYSYKSDGSVDTVEYFDESGKFLRKHTVQLNGLQAYVFIQDDNNRSINLQNRLEGLITNGQGGNEINSITRLDIRLDINGFIKEMFYLEDGRSNRKQDVFSNSGFRYTYDDRGLLENHSYLDAQGNLKNIYGTASFSQSYSGLGLPIEVIFYDKEGNVTNNQHGVAIYKTEYDKFGNVIETKFYDQLGKRIY